ncbi:MAG: lipopolysaccharide heptosyltransferase II [Candidatus Alcyoniella australis]|nr:lipopolysaccharide heptosyltransferase II [Candidatus Alcyoniella australis]
MEPESVLVVQTAYLGDVALTTPLLDALRSAWPATTIDVLVRPEFVPLLAAHPSGARAVPLDKRGKDRGPIGSLLSAARLGRANYDLALSPHRSLRSALTLRLAGIPQRVGFDDAVGARLYTQTVGRDPALHEVERVLSLLPAVGIAVPRKPRLSLGIEQNAQQSVERLLADCAIDSDAALVGVSPSSVWATKRWPPDRFAALINRIVDQTGMRVLLIGGADDSALCNDVLAMCNAGVTNLAGRTTIAELTALISRLALYVTNDSGPMHLAVACNVPLLALFGSTVPEQGYAPYTANCEIVQREGLACRPCGPHGHQRCPEKHFNCMNELGVDQAMAALLMLARRNGVI